MDNEQGKIIQFLFEYFDDEEIVMLCLVEFPAVHNNFAGGMSKQRKITDLVTWCARRGQTEQLKAAMQRERPQLYEQHFSAQPALSSPLPMPPPPRVRNPRQVFISHAHEDAALAQQLGADLEAVGWAVWIAPDSIHPGEQWVTAVNRGLEESGVFVLALTPRAVASKWVVRETNVAIEMEHEGEIRLIPLQIEPCVLPALWRSYQRIPFRGGYDDGLKRLLAELAGRRAAPLEPALRAPTEARRAAPGASEDAPLRPVTTTQNTRLDAKTGKVMVRIPAGEFLYGQNKEKLSLDEYWIDKAPVTNAEYRRFMEADGYATAITGGRRLRPAVGRKENM